MEAKELLLEKIKTRKATICVVGLGYVGLPLAILFASKGFKTIGLDVDENKIEKLKKSSYINTISKTDLGNQIDSGLFIPTNDESRIKDCDCILICVPTPINKNRQPNLEYIKNTVEIINKHKTWDINKS